MVHTVRSLSMLLLLCVPLTIVPFAHAQTPKEVPSEVRALVGTFTGAWTMYGIDAKGDVVKRTSWTDTIRGENPEVKGDRAFISTVDEMTFEGGNMPPMKVQGKEGYLLKSDGSLGDYFMENFGQTIRMVPVGSNVWSYTAPVGAQEWARLGFPADASGQHVLVKVITKEQGVETHRISRLTTAAWKDKEGKERWLQFVSLQGFHKRQP